MTRSEENELRAMRARLFPRQMPVRIERAIRRAIRNRVGYPVHEVECYVVGAYDPTDSANDTNTGCDDKRPLRDRAVKPGDRLDCYVYVWNREFGGEGFEELSENVEVRLGDDCLPTAVLTTSELIREARTAGKES